MTTQHSNSIQQNIYRLADLLAEGFYVDKSTIQLHTNTLINIVGHSDATMPWSVQFPAGGKKIGLDFKSESGDRKLTVWLGKVTAGDVTIETPEGIRTGSERHLAKWFNWLTEGQTKRNHSKTIVAESEARFHPPFVCFQYSRLNSKKIEDLGQDLSEKSIKGIYDKFRKIFPDGSFEIHIDALKRTGEKPNDIGRITLSTGLLEKAFYHGDGAK